MEHLLYFMRKQEIPEEMIWKRAAINQECFIRDVIGNMLKVPTFKISSHVSKSILLPVYGFTMRNGIKVYCRENFYGWKLSIELPKERPDHPFVDILPEDLISEGYKSDESDVYFEGFKTKWVHKGYRPDDRKQKKFSIGIVNNYKFYTVMYLLNHVYEPIKFYKGQEVSAEELAKSIDDIYERFGAREMRNTDRLGFPMEEPVVREWDLMWRTYSQMNDYKFRDAKKLTYEDVNDVEKDPKRFAEMIVRFPELIENALMEIWMFNQKY